MFLARSSAHLLIIFYYSFQTPSALTERKGDRILVKLHFFTPVLAPPEEGEASLC
jgi:hypothetical protein